jgi:Rha family phage regulatory protein
MKELVAKDEYGIFVDSHDTARVSSLYVADCFEKEHRNVLQDIKRITAPESGLSSEFRELNFQLSSYRTQQNKKQPCYFMTRDGFTMLTMGYIGQKAMKFKELYIKRFNEMENFIKTLVSARKEFPLLTDNIKLLYDNPKPYHFSNECDLLNRIVLGMTAKQFRLANGIEKGESIRPYLSDEQIRQLDVLQKIDVGLLVALPNYEDRKMRLEWCKSKIQ